LEYQHASGILQHLAINLLQRNMTINPVACATVNTQQSRTCEEHGFWQALFEKLLLSANYCRAANSCHLDCFPLRTSRFAMIDFSDSLTNWAGKQGLPA
jgi:hypothetical protein